MTTNGDSRYVIEREDGITECTHPLCDQLHQRFIERDMHLVAYVSWHVWDTERGDYAHDTARHFDTKREARAWLATHIGRPSDG